MTTETTKTTEKYERLQIREMFTRDSIGDISHNCKTLDQLIFELNKCKKTVNDVPERFQKYKIIGVESEIKNLGYETASWYILNNVVYEEPDKEYYQRISALKKQEERKEKDDKLAESKQYKEYLKLKKKFSHIEIKEKAQ